MMKTAVRFTRTAHHTPDATGTNIKKHLTPVKGRYFSDNKETARSLYRRGRHTNHSTNLTK